jgi:hypothetical protein
MTPREAHRMNVDWLPGMWDESDLSGGEADTAVTPTFGWEGDSEWGVLTCEAPDCGWSQACQQRDATAVIREHLTEHHRGDGEVPGCGGPVQGAPAIPCGTLTGEFKHLCHGCRIARLEAALGHFGSTVEQS